MLDSFENFPPREELSSVPPCGSVLPLLGGKLPNERLQVCLMLGERVKRTFRWADKAWNAIKLSKNLAIANFAGARYFKMLSKREQCDFLSSVMRILEGIVAHVSPADVENVRDLIS